MGVSLIWLLIQNERYHRVCIWIYRVWRIFWRKPTQFRERNYSLILGSRLQDATISTESSIRNKLFVRRRIVCEVSWVICRVRWKLWLMEETSFAAVLNNFCHWDAMELFKLEFVSANLRWRTDSYPILWGFFPVGVAGEVEVSSRAESLSSSRSSSSPSDSEASPQTMILEKWRFHIHPLRSPMWFRFGHYQGHIHHPFFFFHNL